MNQPLANLSTDLRRISYWFYQGRTKLARKLLDHCLKTYSNLNTSIGCYPSLKKELLAIKKLSSQKLKAAEKALTASLILLHHC
ncbi:hypothetical protein ACFLZP_04700 [Patescibacteria group bacterium]